MKSRTIALVVTVVVVALVAAAVMVPSIIVKGKERKVLRIFGPAFPVLGLAMLGLQFMR
jgi:hypothetical protein